MGFIDSYKQLEKLCGEVMGDDRRVSAYIDKMQSVKDGEIYVENWRGDLKMLKHCRYIRNKIVHEPDCTEQNMVTPEDEQFVKAFYKRIKNGTDPLATYKKSKQRKTSSPGAWFFIATLIIVAALLIIAYLK